MTEGGASTAGTLQGYLVVGHCRDTWWLGTTGTLGGWVLQGHLVVGHCRDTWWLGTAGTLGGWALQGHLVVGHCRDTWWLGTAGTLGGWALKSASSRASTTSSLKSNNPTVRVGIFFFFSRLAASSFSFTSKGSESLQKGRLKGPRASEAFRKSVSLHRNQVQLRKSCFFFYICYMIGVVARQLYINSNTNACFSIAFQENAKNYYFVNSTKPALHGVTFCIFICIYIERESCMYTCIYIYMWHGPLGLRWQRLAFSNAKVCSVLRPLGLDRKRRRRRSTQTYPKPYLA